MPIALLNHRGRSWQNSACGNARMVGGFASTFGKDISLVYEVHDFIRQLLSL